MSSLLAETLAPSIVEVGKIKIGGLGEPRQSQGGRTWRPPVKHDHFTVTTLARDKDGLLIPDAFLMEALKPLADKDGQLRMLPILFPSNDLDEIMQSVHVWYVGKKLAARREGKRVTFWHDPVSGLPLDQPRTGAWEDRFLDQPDPKVKGKPLFKRFTTLNVMIASGGARWGGLYKFRTCGEISARQLYGSLLVLQRAAAGVLRGPTFRLVVRPMQVAPEGKATTVHVVHCEYVSNSASELLQQAQAQASIEAATAVAVAESHKQLKQLLAASQDDGPDEEALDPIEFGSADKQRDPAEVQAELLDAFERGIAAAATVEALRATWVKICEAFDANQITREQSEALGAMKDHRKAIIAVNGLVESVGGWEAVAKEYAEGLGFAGKTPAQLDGGQIEKLREQLVLELKAREERAKAQPATAAA